MMNPFLEGGFNACIGLTQAMLVECIATITQRSDGMSLIADYCFIVPINPKYI